MLLGFKTSMYSYYCLISNSVLVVYNSPLPLTENFEANNLFRVIIEASRANVFCTSMM